MLRLLVLFIVMILCAFVGGDVYKKLINIFKKRKFLRLLSVFSLIIARFRAGRSIYLIRYVLPFVYTWYIMAYNKLHNKEKYANKEEVIDEQQALSILDLQAGASRHEIESAFKRLMMKNHPDHGGSKYFTEKIIQARNILIPKGGKK